MLSGSVNGFGAAVEVPGTAQFRTDILPVLREYCFDCHADGADKGGVSFDSLKSEIAMLVDHDLWWKALRNLRAGISIDQAIAREIGHLTRFPSLELSSDALRTSGAGDQIVGVRFENLAAPAGSVLASADIQFTADEAQTDATALTLRAQAADNAAIFLTNANNLGARPLTAASVAWSPAAWANVGERGPLQQTPDLTALVREVITRPGWISGNAMAFLVSGTGHRTAESADKPGGAPATLTLNYWTELPFGSYARWAAGRPDVISPNTDLDGDGYNHLFEYALGLNPAVPDARAFDFTTDGSQLTLTYTRPSAVLDVTCQIEWRNNLTSGAWSTTGVATRIIADDGTKRIIQAILPAGTAGQRFVRFRVTLR